MVVRFRKHSYKGGNTKDDVPRWHIAVFPYRKSELYQRYVALCGYTIEMPFLRNTLLSYAVKPRGQHCTKCIAQSVKDSR